MPVLFLGHGEQLLHAGPAIVAGEYRKALAGGAIGPLQQLAQQRLAHVMGLTPSEISPRGRGAGNRRRRLAFGTQQAQKLAAGTWGQTNEIGLVDDELHAGPPLACPIMGPAGRGWQRRSAFLLVTAENL